MSDLVVVMGVSGSGKSTIGAGLASELGTPFIDGDELHPAANVAKMSAGIPLNDEDRAPWLAAVGRALAEAGEPGLVVACSALKRSYRDAIRAEAPGTVFVHLSASKGLLSERLASRSGHFMPPSLLESQFETLEPLATDERGTVIDVGQSVAGILRDAIAGLRGFAASSHIG